MRRLFRYALNGLTALSALLCVAACVLWPRGYVVSEGHIAVTVDADGAYTRLVVNRWGAVVFLRLTHERSARSPKARWISEPAQRFEPRRGEFSFLGFRYDVRPPIRGFLRSGRVYTVPWWFVLAVASPLPLIRSRRWLRRRRRTRSGRCPACGYDLTGNTSGVCPECGGAVGAAKGVWA